MKIRTITYTERKNLGNYEFAELSSIAELLEGEDEVTAVEKLMAFVTNSINKEVTVVHKQEEIVKEVLAEITVAAVKEKKTKEKKEKSAKVTVEAVIPEEKVKEEVAAPLAKNVVIYNSNLAEHKSIFGGYLAKKYDNAWKTVAPAEEIKAFTATLNGKHFLDNDGKIVDSFLELVHGFFGA